MVGRKGNILLTASFLQSIGTIDYSIALWASEGVSKLLFIGNMKVKREENTTIITIRICLSKDLSVDVFLTRHVASQQTCDPEGGPRREDSLE